MSSLQAPELSVPDGRDNPVRRVVLGPPGVYLAPGVPRRRLDAEPMDVVGFVGVAPRGPAYEPVDDPTLHDRGVTHARSVPVTVDSWDEYQEAFGGFSGPGLLPHAVAAFFAQGGRRAVVVRVVADAGPGRPPGAVPPGCARYDLGSGLPPLRARSEGSWGNRLTVTLTFTTRTLAVTALRPDQAGGTALVLEPGSGVPVGALVRLRTPDRPTRPAALATVTRLVREGRPGAVEADLVATLDRPVATSGDDPVVELVEAELTVADNDPERPRRERFAGLGTRPAHPCYLADVLRRRSRLLTPVERPVGFPDDPGFEPDPALTPLSSGAPCPAGVDRWHLVTEDDVLGDARAVDPDATNGVGALASAPEAATVVVPDLYAPAVPVTDAPAASPAGDPAFRPCVPRPPTPGLRPAPPDALAGLLLDPADPDGLAAVVARQARLVAAAQQLELVALLDVPPGLRAPQVQRWRAAFDSSYAAAYHPWLRVPGPDPDRLVDLPPSTVAAGVLAASELRRGLSRGPANEVAAGVVDVAEAVDDERHAALHRLGIDVFRAEPAGVVLTAARTLSADPVLRQLTARRLLLLVRRAVRRQLAWTAFEPDDDALRAGLRRHLDHLLGSLFDAGAFAGTTPAESWFVRISDPGAVGPGQVVVEIGLAPSAPLEFVVVRVALDAAGAIEPGLDVGESGVHGA
jgi:hypothetical protein